VRCPACGTGAGEVVLVQRDVPVLQNRVWDSIEHARTAPTGSLELAWCPSCDHVWNSAFEPSKLRYDASYDNRQDASPAFSAYLQERLEVLSRALSPQDVIVEVGCGQGRFLDQLCRASGSQGHGFDPAYRGTGHEGRARVHATPYTAAQAEIRADLVVCRHVIEHVPRPLHLLRDVRAALRRRSVARVFFECPAVEWILHGQVLWDLFYEHVHYFSERSLRAAFVRSGFRVMDQQRVFDGQYQWLEARPATRKEPFPMGFAELASQVLPLQDVLDTWIERVQERLQAQPAGSIALWGAGAKGATLARLADPDGTHLAGVVDLNPAKQGGHLAGSGHQVLAPHQLRTRDVREVWVMNPAYHDEICEQVDREDLRVQVRPAPLPRSAPCSPSSPSASPPGTALATSSVA